MTNADEKRRAIKFLGELRKKRESHLKSCRENNDYSRERLQDISGDPAQCIYELIQNADDSGAKEITFKLCETGLEVRHNGTSFDCDDLDAITASGYSTKTTNKIGKFGVGFKSVYKITDEPLIHSGYFSFKIRELMVPVAQSNPQDNSNETLISLPFKNDEPREQIQKKFDELSDQGEILFFLQSVSSIAFIYDDDTRKQLTIKRKKVRKSAIRKHLNKIKATEVSCTDSNGDCPFLVIESNEVLSTEYPHTVQAVSAENPHAVQVAFQMDPESRRIVPCTLDNNSIFVFFPTEERCDLPFLVHAPYQITSNRANIQKNTPYNRQITKLLAALVADSLPLIRDLKLLDNKFLNELVPLSKGNDDDSCNTPLADKLYNAIVNAVMDKLTVEALLPSAQGGYITADKAAVPLDDAVASFLDLPKGNQWLASKPELIGGKLINKLGIERFSLETLADNSEFIKAKDWGWLDKFYKAINETFESSGDIANKFGDKSIVPLADGNLAKPSSDIFLPTEGTPSNSDFKFIESAIAQKENAREFFRHFKIRKVGNSDRVKKIVERYQNPQLDNESYKGDILDIERLYSLSKSAADSAQRSTIEAHLASAYIVLCGDGNLYKPSAKYLPSPEILAWFENIETNPNIVKLIGTPDEQERQMNLFSSIGCWENVQLKDTDTLVLHWPGRHEIGIGGFNPDFDIDGLEAALQDINFERSKILWSILLNNYAKLRGQVRKSTNERAVYEATPINMDSTVAEKLDEHDWIYNKQTELIQRSDLQNINPATLSEMLHDDYTDPKEVTGVQRVNVDALLEIIINRKDISREEHDAIVEAKDEVIRAQEEKIQQLELREQARSQSASGGRPSSYASDGHDDSSDDWQPECAPEDVVFDIRDADSPAPLTRAPSEKSECNEQTEDEKEAAEEKAPLIAAKVGRWGEEVVFLKLKEEHPDSTVAWENERDEAGNSYDISIKRDDATKTYAEVKSTKKSSPAVFRINASQWRTAKECESDSTDKYVFYFVFKAGSKYPEVVKLESPEARFKAGTLICHPLGLRISVADDELDSPSGDAEDAV